MDAPPGPRLPRCSPRPGHHHPLQTTGAHRPQVTARTPASPVGPATARPPASLATPEQSLASPARPATVHPPASPASAGEPASPGGGYPGGPGGGRPGGRGGGRPGRRGGGPDGQPGAARRGTVPGGSPARRVSPTGQVTRAGITSPAARDQPDRSPGHPPRPGRAPWRSVRVRSHRPRPRPGPRRSGRRPPGHVVVRDRHRLCWPPRRPRLRPLWSPQAKNSPQHRASPAGCSATPQATARYRAGRARQHHRPTRPARLQHQRPAGRLRDLAAPASQPWGTALADLTVDLEPVPVSDCDHSHQTVSHDPSRHLRHLVEIRDGELHLAALSA